MIVNGEEKSLQSSVSVSDYLISNKYNANAVVVEINGRIVPKGDYGKIILSDSDAIEVLAFIGGG
ncbi:MAG: sulfur carrier protein ThiS [Rhodospirillaceae bacterium]|nr:sulfur carrier protein ThiS [Rhodospirillaceae bacterium]